MIRGSIRKRGETWYYRLELAKINGKRQQVERVGGRSKDEAISAMNKAIHEYETTGTLLVNSSISTADYLEHWFDNYVLVELKLNTQKNYRGMLDKHIIPEIG